jgi:hypothetical protein
VVRRDRARAKREIIGSKWSGGDTAAPGARYPLWGIGKIVEWTSIPWDVDPISC